MKQLLRYEQQQLTFALRRELPKIYNRLPAANANLFALTTSILPRASSVIIPKWRNTTTISINPSYSFSSTSATTKDQQKIIDSIILSLKSDERLNTPVEDKFESYFPLFQQLTAAELMSIIQSELDSLPFEYGIFLCKITMDALVSLKEEDQTILLNLCNITITYIEDKHKQPFNMNLIRFKTLATVYKANLTQVLDLAPIDNQYKSMVSSLSDLDKRDILLFIVSNLFEIKQFSAAQTYAKQALEIVKTQYKEKPSAEASQKLCITESYLFYIAYYQGKFLESIEYGLSISKIIPEIQVKTDEMHYVLVCVAFSYALLSQKQQSDEFLKLAMDLLKQIPESKIDPVSALAQYTEGQQRILAQQNHSNNQRPTDTESGKPQKGINEILADCEKELESFNESTEPIKVITLNLRIAELHFHMGKLNKSIASNLQARKHILSLTQKQVETPQAKQFGMINLASLATLYSLTGNTAESDSFWEEHQLHCFGSTNPSLDLYPQIIQTIQESMTNQTNIQQVEVIICLSDYLERTLSKNSAPITAAAGTFTDSSSSSQNTNEIRASLLKISYELLSRKQDCKSALEKAIEVHYLRQNDIEIVKDIYFLSAVLQDSEKIIGFGKMYLEKGNKFDQDYSSIQLNVGKFLAKTGNFKEAEEYLKESVEITKHDSTGALHLKALLALASVLGKQGKLAEALLFVDQTQELTQKESQNLKKPKQIDALQLAIQHLYCQIYKQQNEFAKSLAAAEIFVKQVKGKQSFQEATLDPIKPLFQALLKEHPQPNLVKSIIDKYQINID